MEVSERPGPGNGEAEILEELLRRARSYDDALDDAPHGGAGARPPTGDDYNRLMGLLGHARDRLEEMRGAAREADGDEALMRTVP